MRREKQPKSGQALKTAKRRSAISERWCFRDNYQTNFYVPSLSWEITWKVKADFLDQWLIMCLTPGYVYIHAPELPDHAMIISVRKIIMLKGRKSHSVVHLQQIISPEWHQAWLKLEPWQYGWFLIMDIH